MADGAAAIPHSQRLHSALGISPPNRQSAKPLNSTESDFAKLDSLVYASNDVLAIMSRARLRVLLLQL